jgi:hypothetical protein
MNRLGSAFLRHEAVQRRPNGTDGARFRRTNHDDQGFVGQVSELIA